MKIITLERLTMDGEPVYEDEGNTRDWWCVIETEEEDMVYDLAINEEGNYLVLWNNMIKHAGGLKNLCWGEDDIYGYFHPHEKYPEIGEEHTDADGDRWGRVE